MSDELTREQRIECIVQTLRPADPVSWAPNIIYVTAEFDSYDATLRAHLAEWDAVEQYIGCNFDNDTQTFVSGKPPYLSAGTSRVEAIIAAVDALRLVISTFETKYTDMQARLAKRDATIHDLQERWHYAATCDSDLDYVEETRKLTASLAEREAALKARKDG